MVVRSVLFPNVYEGLNAIPFPKPFRADFPMSYPGYVIRNPD